MWIVLRAHCLHIQRHRGCLMLNNSLLIHVLKAIFPLTTLSVLLSGVLCYFCPSTHPFLLDYIPTPTPRLLSSSLHQECLHSSCCFQALRSMTNGCISRLIKGDQGVRKSYEAPRRGFPNESAHNLHER